MNRVIVKRDFLGFEVRQYHDTKFFSLTDFLTIFNRWDKQRGGKGKFMSDFLKRAETKELIKAIQDNEGLVEVCIPIKGKNGGTFAHPLLLIELAMYCDRSFKYKALNWVKDKLCEYRDSSGESYKTLSAVIDKALNLPKGDKALSLAIMNTAYTIKNHLGITDWNKATEEQLRKRDNIHRDLCLLLEAGVALSKALEIVIARPEYNQ